MLTAEPVTNGQVKMMDLPDGTKLPALADGEYDAIVLGTGLKECIISGVCCVYAHTLRAEKS